MRRPKALKPTETYGWNIYEPVAKARWLGRIDAPEENEAAGSLPRQTLWRANTINLSPELFPSGKRNPNPLSSAEALRPRKHWQ
jgi:hypothetical protein